MSDISPAPKRIIAMIVAMKPTTFDEAAVRAAFGPSYATSLGEVAEAYGVSFATVKHTWRPAGFPGDGRQHCYPWADGVLWWLRRNIAAERTREASSVFSDGERRELASIQLATARADLSMRQTKLTQLQGQYVPVVIVQATMKQILNVLRDALCGIPQTIEPMLPARQADRLAAEVGRAIRNALTAASETPIDDIVERVNANDESTVGTNHE